MKRHRWIRALYIWHRRIGVAAALLVLLLAVTGLPLNHADRLQLGSRHVASPLVLDWYGIGAPRVPPGWEAGGHWFTVVADGLHFDDRLVAQARGALRGVRFLPEAGLYLVAFEQALLLLDDRGNVVEWLPPPAGAGPVRGLAASDEGRILLIAEGGAWIADAELLGWRPAPDHTPAAIPAARPLPEPLRARLAQAARARAITLERLLLDLHSGRLFGRFGPWMMDAAAVLLVLLSLSGGFLWARQAWKRRRHHSHRH